MIYDKEDALFDSLEAVIDCPSAIWFCLAIYLPFPHPQLWEGGKATHLLQSEPL